MRRTFLGPGRRRAAALALASLASLASCAGTPTLDESRLFRATADAGSRSLMNVTFVTGDAEIDAKFISEAKAAGLDGLKGHRSVGGMRASIYNAFPPEGVDALVEFMRGFEVKNAP